MDYYRNSSKWSRKRLVRVDVCIVCACIYLCCLTPAVDCKSEELTKDSLKISRISIEYRDISGYRKSDDDYERGYYANNARVNCSPIKGKLVHVQTSYNNSELGCSPINPEIVPKNEPWVALIKRGDCTFSEKIYYAAKKSSASALVIYNHGGSVLIHADNEKETHLTMTTITVGGHNVQDVVAILIRYDKGKDLVDMLEAHNNINITITRAPKKGEQQECPGQLNNTSVLFVSISFIVSSVVLSVICRLSNATHDI